MATVRKILDCSTAYLPTALRDGREVSGFDERPTGYYPTDVGALLWVPDDPSDGAAPDGADSHPAIVAIRRVARALGCDYVLFDCDGPELDEADDAEIGALVELPFDDDEDEDEDEAGVS